MVGDIRGNDEKADLSISHCILFDVGSIDLQSLLTFSWVEESMLEKWVKKV